MSEGEERGESRLEMRERKDDSVCGVKRENEIAAKICVKEYPTFSNRLPTYLLKLSVISSKIQ